MSNIQILLYEYYLTFKKYYGILIIDKIIAMEKGGYIFIHNYNSRLCLGVEKAVVKYEEELGEHLCKAPICDISGTLIITK